jgi:hypothetical protein
MAFSVHGRRCHSVCFGAQPLPALVPPNMRLLLVPPNEVEILTARSRGKIWC